MIFNFLKAWLAISKNKKEIYFYMLITFILIVMISLLGVYLPVLMKSLIDSANKEIVYIDFENLFTINNLAYIVIIYATAWLFLNILNWVKNTFNSLIMIKIMSSLLYDGMNNYLKIKNDELRKIEVGVFHTDLLRGSDSFGQIVSTCMFIIIPSLLQISMMIVVVYLNFDFTYSILFFFSTFIVFLVCAVTSIKTKDIFSKFYESRNILNNQLIEKISNTYDIKINNSNAYEMFMIDKNIKTLADENFKSNLKLSMYMILQVTMIGLFLLTFMLIAVDFFKEDKISSGDFVLIGTYIVELTTPFLLISQNLIQLKGHLLSVERYNAYNDIDKDFFYDKEDINNKEYFFNFINASFKLGDKNVKKFNFKIIKNRTYVLIGKTGIGKTTLINYMLGIKSIDSGEIFYKNINITKSMNSKIFDEVAVVQQNPIIYNGTLRDNLILNSKEVFTDEYLIDLLSKFKLNSILTNNEISLDSNIQNFYKSLSGGEKQRLSIIRALLKKPKIIIMDEPTSALDYTIGLEMINYIKELVGTLVIITHSQDLKLLADDILNVEEI